MAAVFESAPDQRWDGHLLLLHDTEAERRTALTAWVRRGLECGDKVVYIEVPTEPHGRLLDVLRSEGVDAATAAADGRLVVLPPADFYLPERQVEVVGRALAEGFPGVRVSAEASTALTVLKPDDYLCIERTVDQLCWTGQVSALCQYKRSTSLSLILRDTVAVHLAGIRQPQLSASFDGQRLHLHGEVDLTNADILAEAVRAAADAVTQVLWLDLAGLRFVDAAACRHLVEASHAFRNAGGHLLLVAASPRVERVMRILALDDLPGVHLIGGWP